MLEVSVMQSIANYGIRAGEYVNLAISENTRRAYRADLDHFRSWGGNIPCTAETLADYLAAFAGVLACATLTRRLASISKAHTMQSLTSPAGSDLVKMTMRGIRRAHGRPQVQVSPLLKDDLTVVISKIPDDLRGARDRALLLIGFCAALRRSELSIVRVEDLSFSSEGLILTLPRSKTDQTGEGRNIGIPFGHGKICPVLSLKCWLDRAGISSGFVFRAIAGPVLNDQPLTDRSIVNVIKARAKQAGLDPASYSGHSLRSGLATSAAQHGFSSWDIRRQTGHRSDAMLARYIRIGGLFRNNAAALF